MTETYHYDGKEVTKAEWEEYEAKQNNPTPPSQDE